MATSVTVAPKTREDDELGPVRWCGRCAEWWPDDGEFWHLVTYRAGTVARTRGRAYTRRTSGVSQFCKACARESNRLAYERRRDARRKVVAA